MISEPNCTIRGYATPDGEVLCIECAHERYTEEQRYDDVPINESGGILTHIHIEAVWDYDNECYTCGSPLDSTVL